MLDGENSEIISLLVVTVWIKCLIARAVRDQRQYVRNYRSELPYFRALAFRTCSFMKGRSGNKAGSLSAQQQFYFVSPRPLKSCTTPRLTPELVNLAGNRACTHLARMRGALDDCWRELETKALWMRGHDRVHVGRWAAASDR